MKNTNKMENINFIKELNATKGITAMAFVVAERINDGKNGFESLGQDLKKMWKTGARHTMIKLAKTYGWKTPKAAKKMAALENLDEDDPEYARIDILDSTALDISSEIEKYENLLRLIDVANTENQIADRNALMAQCQSKTSELIETIDSFMNECTK